MTETQGLLDVFEPPYRTTLRVTIVWCGCCQRWAYGYDAVHNGHNHCNLYSPRGLGCECLGMTMTLGHVLYELRLLRGGIHEFCYCSGDTRQVHGGGRKHRQTPEHLAAQMANYWIPRALDNWPPERHEALRAYIDAYARYLGVLDLVRGDA